MKRGFSLAETLVAGFLFLLIGLLGLALMMVGRKGAQESDIQGEVFTQGGLAVARVRQELRGSQLLEPGESVTASEVRFRYPRLVDGELQVDAGGRPVWEGTARLFQQSDTLMLEKPVGSPARLLARLYDGSFQVELSGRLLRVSVTVDRDDESSQGRARFERSFRLAVNPAAP